MLDTVSKKALIDSLEIMPDQISVNELLDKIKLLSKIEKGIKASEEGKVVSHQEAKQRFAKWLE